MQSDLISIEQLIRGNTDMQPLTLNVPQSPVSSHHDDTDVDEDSSIHESTPIKSQPLPFSSKPLASQGLLAYSTPVIGQQIRQPFSAIISQSQSAKSSARKPRVNFHSIDDIVNTVVAKDENNDSGVSNMSHSVNSSASISAFSSPSFMYLNSISSQSAVQHAQDASIQESDENSEAQSLASSSKMQDGTEKKVRTTFTDHQKKMLDFYFKKNPYPDPRETEELSQQLVLPENVIKVWFQNKRSRDKQRKFSNKNAAKIQSMQMQSQQINNAFASPIIANLHLLSKLNGFNSANNASQMLALYTQSLMN